MSRVEFYSLSVPIDIGQKHHHNMEYDQVPFPTRVAPPLFPHDSVDDETSRLVNLEVMDLSTGNPREIMHLYAYRLPN